MVVDDRSLLGRPFIVSINRILRFILFKISYFMSYRIPEAEAYCYIVNNNGRCVIIESLNISTK